VLDSNAAWSRGTLRGFARVAHEQGWALFHYRHAANIDLLAMDLAPAAAVLGPAHSGAWPERLRDCVGVAVNVDRTAEGIPSVELDAAKTAELAASHLLDRGFRNLTTFRFDTWGTLREQRFREVAARRGAHLEPSWWSESAVALRTQDRPAAIIEWLSSLRKPCGIFAGCDGWSRVLARYARAASLRVPEEVALIGIDNDLFDCEIESPPLSSVAVPWQRFGEAAARLVQLGLRGQPLPRERVLVPPLDVVVRRSSDTFAIDDPLVAMAVRWIHDHFAARITVPKVAGAVRSTRQRLERHFRQKLGRTVLQEIRRTRVEAARRLLATTNRPLLEIARTCGFTNAALLSVAFQREVGVPPGAYRKKMQSAQPSPEE
jgi:LacI family transcriptional regulator